MLTLTAKINGDVVVDIEVVNKRQMTGPNAGNWCRYEWVARGPGIEHAGGSFSHRRGDGMPVLIERLMRELAPHWPIPRK